MLLDIPILASLFIAAFLLNFVWEVWHSQLYITCLTMPLGKVIRLLTLQSLKDAFWISFFYTITVVVFRNQNPFEEWTHLITFALITLGFAWVVEYHALRTKRWEYADTMPRVLGVGITPLLELCVTGVLALTVTFWVV